MECVTRTAWKYKSERAHFFFLKSLYKHIEIPSKAYMTSILLIWQMMLLNSKFFNFIRTKTRSSILFQSTPRICLFILNFPFLKSVILTNMSKLCNCFIDFSVYSDIYCFLNRLFTQVFLNAEHKLRSKCLQMVWITWRHGISCNAGVLHRFRLFKFHRLFKIIEWKMRNLIKIWFILS